MDIISYLQQNLGLTLTLVAIIGLVIGSFLNVVISRYPIMQKNMWKAECEEFLEITPTEKPSKLNLLTPRSHCPKCKNPIKAWHNIPLLSYLFLRGKCAFCKTDISAIYPIVELLSAAVAIIMVCRFDVTWEAFAAIIFSWGLITLSFIDFKEQFLPDTITISLLWIGLFVSCYNYFTTPEYAIMGAIIGYLILWSIAKLFKAIRKKEGMGYGDFKMLAMLCAWLGVGALLNVLLSAVFVALIVSLVLLGFKKIAKKNPIPFGPFLALGGFFTMIYGPFIVDFIVKVGT